MAFLISDVGYQLTSREKARGGGVRAVEPLQGFPQIRKGERSRLVIWIHGYNVNLREASVTWAKTAETLRAAWRCSLEDVAVFYWPGDFDLGVVSPLGYPAKLKTAHQAASSLCDFLGALRSKCVPLRVDFVAHSLGCLVALETIRQLIEKGFADFEASRGGHDGCLSIGKVLLMAAAVPQGLCISGTGVYGFKGEESVLYSVDDRVLWACFKLGEAVGRLFDSSDASRLGGESYHRRAVGRDGGPSSRWGQSQPMSGFDHEDFWVRIGALEYVAEILGSQSRRDFKEWSTSSRTIHLRKVDSWSPPFRARPGVLPELANWRATQAPLW